jgi:hypothetical protein
MEREPEHIETPFDSAEVQKQLAAYVTHIGFMTPADVAVPAFEKGAAFLKKLSPDAFLTLLSTINKFARQLSRPETPATDADYIFIESPDFKEEPTSLPDVEKAMWYARRRLSALYRAPHNAQQLMKDFFVDFKNKLDGGDSDKLALSMRVAVYLAHLFRDGNTRTTRIINEVLRTGTVDIDARDDVFAHVSSTVLKIALFRLVQKTLAMCVQTDKPTIDTFSDIETTLRLNPAHTLGTTQGLAMPLQVLVMMRVFPELSCKQITEHCVGIKKRNITPDIAVPDIPFTLELLEASDDYYALQDELFWEAQRVIDEHEGEYTLESFCAELRAVGGQC